VSRNRGGEARLPALPSLRTVRAVLPHTALRSVVSPRRGWTAGTLAKHALPDHRTRSPGPWLRPKRSDPPRSPPVAFRLSSRRRSYLRLRAFRPYPGRDFHPAGSMRSGAHTAAPLIPPGGGLGAASGQRAKRRERAPRGQLSSRRLVDPPRRKGRSAAPLIPPGGGLRAASGQAGRSGRCAAAAPGVPIEGGLSFLSKGMLFARACAEPLGLERTRAGSPCQCAVAGATAVRRSPHPAGRRTRGRFAPGGPKRREGARQRRSCDGGRFFARRGSLLAALARPQRLGADPGTGRATSAPSPARRRSAAPLIPPGGGLGAASAGGRSDRPAKGG